VLPSDTDELAAMLPGGCAVCGATAFFFQDVLWPELIAEWQLGPEEVRYINIQQGFSCSNCRNNLRSMTLARAICDARHHRGTLDGWTASPAASDCKILEINAAGFLTKHLSVVPGHVLVAYPDADIHALKYDDDTFDLVIHSDTLEHVPDPVHALAECRRVLKRGGTLAFTVPVIVGRLSRSRKGLAVSYHGASSDLRPDYIVETEFGADAPCFILEAGFSSLEMHADIYPASIAFSAQK
jgi:SAM-dependent methyltransferase